MLRPPSGLRPSARRTPRGISQRVTRFARFEREQILAHALSRGGIARSAVSSGIATGSDFLLVALLVSGLGVAAPLATLVGCVFGAVVNFTVNRRWAFGSDAPRVQQAMRYVFVSATSAVYNSALVAVLLLIPGAPYALVWWIVRAGVFALWNYPLSRDYVFAPAPVGQKQEGAKARRSWILGG